VAPNFLELTGVPPISRFCEGWNTTLSDGRSCSDRFEAAKLESVFAVPCETVELDAIIRLMESKTSTNLIFLDTCRSNRLTDNLAAVNRAITAGAILPVSSRSLWREGFGRGTTCVGPRGASWRREVPGAGYRQRPQRL
jgi:hypothetical protein